MKYKLFLVLGLMLCAGIIFAQQQVSFYQTKTFKTAAVPTLLIGYGLACNGSQGWPSSHDVKQFRQKHLPTFNVSIDDYLVFAPAVAVYALDLAKVKSKHDVLNQTILFAKTTALTMGVVYALKYTTNETRPDGSNHYSFPSGHTAMVFAWAEVLHQEFKETNQWIGAIGYVTAASVGALRMANNKHWFNDVLVGAGIGMLSTKVVYLTHQNKYKTNWLNNSACLPMVGNKHLGLSLVHAF
jgi:hypothetical protein